MTSEFEKSIEFEMPKSITPPWLNPRASNYSNLLHCQHRWNETERDETDNRVRTLDTCTACGMQRRGIWIKNQEWDPTNAAGMWHHKERSAHTTLDYPKINPMPPDDPLPTPVLPPVNLPCYDCGEVYSVPSYIDRPFRCPLCTDRARRYAK